VGVDRGLAASVVGPDTRQLTRESQAGNIGDLHAGNIGALLRSERSERFPPVHPASAQPCNYSDVITFLYIRNPNGANIYIPFIEKKTSVSLIKKTKIDEHVHV
jgi:hypothetical protein